MSLLMDALKKAELAKQQAPAADGAALELEPIPGTTPAEDTGKLPELPLKLEDLDAEFIAHARSAPPGRPAVERRAQQPPRPAPPPQAEARPAPDPSRAAVRNAFAVKEPPPAASRRFAVVVGAITLLAVAAIGTYFWWQLRPTPALVQPAPPLARAPAPDPAQHAPAPALAPPEAEVPAPEPAPPAAVPVPRPAREAPPARPATAAPPIRVAGGSRPAVAPGLQQAYDSFQAGDLAMARSAYQRLLDKDPRQADALRGLAAIALREGRPAEAEAHYLRLLEADPRDGLAIAGLLGLRGPADPVAGESRLQTLIAGQPELPVLHFALGNLYAGQSRWSEAQQAYFKAVTGEPDNPDFLFNLAVSLDQLHQAPLAAQYYEKALSAAARRPGGFDPGQAQARLRELRP